MQQAMFEVAASANRYAGSGGGIGMQVVNVMGTSNQSGGTQTFTSASYASVPGTSLTVLVSRPMSILLLAIGTGQVTAGTTNGLLRLNPGAAGAATGGINFGNQIGAFTLMGYEILTAVQPGTYTMLLEAAVSGTPATFSLYGSNLTVIGFGL